MPNTITGKKQSKLNKLLSRKESEYLFASFVLAITALVVINSLYIVNRLSADKTSPQPVAIQGHNKILTSEQTAVSDAYKISISNVYETNAPDPAFTLAKGETLLVLDLNVTNRSSGEQNFFPVNQLFVRDNDGDFYTMHASMHIRNPIKSGAIKPGETYSGQVSFSIPSRLSNPLLYVDLGWNNYTPVVFSVLK